MLRTGRGGSPSDDSGLAVVQLDREGGFGDVDRDGLMLVRSAECHLLTADGDHSGAGDPALDANGFGRRAGRWAGWPVPAEPDDLVVAERVRPYP